MTTDAAQLKQQQRELWDSLSQAWDQHDAWFQRQTHGITEWLCRVADLRGGQRVLDIACGSGQPALTAARLVRPGGSVVATDISEEMLRVARRKANMADLDNIEFKQMDAEALDFPDESFDGVLCRWGLMFCPDPERATREAHRVLKRNRPFATTTFAEAKQNPFFEITTRITAQHLGEPPPPADALTPLRLSDTGRLKSILQSAGFQQIEIEGRPFAWEFNDLEHFWRFSSEFTPIMARAMKTLDAGAVEKLKSDLLEEASKYREGGRIRFPALALGVYAQK
ncbi:MAG TPA: class I SAM-dependent methyltransferase [Dehalococcoidia bacterium]|nr:class I SAM-dependent methyltransferase [Dehalococcoidia bacterium]